MFSAFFQGPAPALQKLEMLMDFSQSVLSAELLVALRHAETALSYPSLGSSLKAFFVCKEFLETALFLCGLGEKNVIN